MVLKSCEKSIALRNVLKVYVFEIQFNEKTTEKLS